MNDIVEEEIELPSPILFQKHRYSFEEEEEDNSSDKDPISPLVNKEPFSTEDFIPTPPPSELPPSNQLALSLSFISEQVQPEQEPPLVQQQSSNIVYPKTAIQNDEQEQQQDDAADLESEEEIPEFESWFGFKNFIKKNT